MTLSRALGAAVFAGLLAASGCVPAPRSFSLGDRPGTMRVAVLPLANYSQAQEAADLLRPMIATEIGALRGVEVVDPGVVEAALSKEPWLMMDRVPPDLLQRFGTEMSADALVVGSILGFGFREEGGDRIPQISVSLRLLRAADGRVLWSAVHSRDGEDGEWLFGFGKTRSLEQLAAETVREITRTFPNPGAAREESKMPLAGTTRGSS